MSSSVTSQLADKALYHLARFFKAEWSGALVAIIILGVAIELVTGGRPFFHPTNLMTVFNNSAAIGVVAAGMTLVIITAGIDLSVGSVMGMTAALTGYVASFWGFPPYLAMMTGLSLGLIIGAFHGTMVAYLGMPAFIVTLAGLSIWRGSGHLSTGAQATPRLPETFDIFGRHNPFAEIRAEYKAGNLEGISFSIGQFVDANWLSFFRTFQMSMVIFVLFFIVLSVLISNTRYGRYVYAIGSNISGARQSGINVRFYTLITYMFCSLSAAFGALLFLGRAPYAKSDYGQMWELDAIAAVVIGGTSLFGGRGSLWGTFMGVILLKLINNGLTLAQLNTFWQMVVTGLIIIVAVGIDIVRQSRDAEKVRRLLVSIGALMGFFTLLTPANLYLKAKLVLLEHRSAMTLKLEGVKLAPGQTRRLLSPSQIEGNEFVLASHLMPSVLFLLLVVGAALLFWRANKYWSFTMSAGFVLMCGPVIVLGYQITIPFLIFGAIAMAASTLIGYLFERARKLDVEAI